ncbi:hypothetical protein FQN60_014182 [Etheostoma spectabile]|uniref:Uncharacterized protein n=1 Tax=Etheostoma spectabile TaxID=54343 RepID=A0A5J5D6A9_9PERO|nr:hypothetical protein FQN60_014182 [Etheostoma spectabile]
MGTKSTNRQTNEGKSNEDCALKPNVPFISPTALLVCPGKEAVGEGHWQVISIPAGSAYSALSDLQIGSSDLHSSTVAAQILHISQV